MQIHPISVNQCLSVVQRVFFLKTQFVEQCFTHGFDRRLPSGPQFKLRRSLIDEQLNA